MKKGSHHTEKAKQKMREANLGKKHSEKTKQKMHKTHLGVVPWNTGRTATEETKRKMRESHLGEKNIMYGKHHTEESNQKNREKHLGRHHTEEARKNMRESSHQLLGENNRGWKGGLKANIRRMRFKRRELGFIELNDSFIGADAHHLDKEFVLYIPKELHRSVYHNMFTGQNMEEMNDLAIEFEMERLWEEK